MNESWIIIYKCCVPGLGWTYPCDLWSVGCILVELCSVCDICHIVARAKLKLHCLLLTSAHCLSHSKVTCTFFHINFRVCWSSGIDLAGRCLVSDTWEPGAFGDDGASAWAHSSTHGQKGRVCTCQYGVLEFSVTDIRVLTMFGSLMYPFCAE
jgi:hypothetical protein